MGPRPYRIALFVAVGHFSLIGLMLMFGVGSVVPPTPMPIQLQFISPSGNTAQPSTQRPAQRPTPQSATKSATTTTPAAAPIKPRSAETSPALSQSMPIAGQSVAESKAGGSTGAGGSSAAGAPTASVTTGGPAITGTGAVGDSGPRVDASFKGNRLPEYPAMSRRLGEQGVVVLRVFITPEGRAADVQLVKSSGSARLDRSAMESIREWRFVPARQSGRPVGAWYEWRWEFRLDG